MIGPMTKLGVFNAYNNNFTRKLPIEFTKLKKLKTLHLGGNYFYSLLRASELGEFRFTRK